MGSVAGAVAVVVSRLMESWLRLGAAATTCCGWHEAVTASDGHNRGSKACSCSDCALVASVVAAHAPSGFVCIVAQACVALSGLLSVHTLCWYGWQDCSVSVVSLPLRYIVPTECPLLAVQGYDAPGPAPAACPGHVTRTWSYGQVLCISFWNARKIYWFMQVASFIRLKWYAHRVIKHVSGVRRLCTVCRE